MLYLDASEPSPACLQATEVASVFLANRDTETEAPVTLKEAFENVVVPAPPRQEVPGELLLCKTYEMKY